MESGQALVVDCRLVGRMPIGDPPNPNPGGYGRKMEPLAELLAVVESAAEENDLIVSKP